MLYLIEAVAIDGCNAICWGQFNGTKNDGGEVPHLFTSVLIFDDKKIRRLREYHLLPKLEG